MTTLTADFHRAAQDASNLRDRLGIPYDAPPTRRAQAPGCPWQPDPHPEWAPRCSHCDDPHVRGRAALFALSQRRGPPRAVITTANLAIDRIESYCVPWSREAGRFTDAELLEMLGFARVALECARESRAGHLFTTSLGHADLTDGFDRAKHRAARARLAALTAEANARIARYEGAARAFRRTLRDGRKAKRSTP
jgi:hypothetical protein